MSYSIDDIESFSSVRLRARKSFINSDIEYTVTIKATHKKSKYLIVKTKKRQRAVEAYNALLDSLESKND